MWCDFCAHADLLNQPMRTVSIIKMAGLDVIKTQVFASS